jgi:hypothetical protein
MNILIDPISHALRMIKHPINIIQPFIFTKVIFNLQRRLSTYDLGVSKILSIIIVVKVNIKPPTKNFPFLTLNHSFYEDPRY